VLVNRGTGNGGYALYVKARRLHFDHNFFHEHSHVASDVDLPIGACTVGVRVDSDLTSGQATLTIDDRVVGSTPIPRVGRTLSSLGMDIGRCVAPVCDDYVRPFAFTGGIDEVRFTIDAATQKTAAELTAEARVALGLH
jgi:hypothetical protein